MDAIFEIMGYVAVFYAAFHLGKHWALFQFSRSIVSKPEDMIQVLEQVKRLNALDLDLPEDTQALEIERVGNQLYAYKQETKEFMGQGPDLSTLIAQIEQRFPGEKFFGKLAQTNSAKDLVSK
jgi:hypothetical protein